MAVHCCIFNTAIKAPSTKGVWEHAPKENFKILSTLGVFATFFSAYFHV